MCSSFAEMLMAIRRHGCRRFAVSMRKVKWSWVVDGLAQGRFKAVVSWTVDWRTTHRSRELLCVSDSVCKTYDVRRLLSFCPEPSVFQFYTKIYLYKIIILPTVLYGCETWSLRLKEEHRLRIFENRVQRNFGRKREKIPEVWRNLHNKKLNDQ